MKYLKFTAIVLIGLLGCKSGNMGKVKYGENGTVISGESKTRCTQPSKRYAKELELKVAAEVDSLSTVPLDKMEIGLKQTVAKLSDYTSEGLDLDLFLFRICEMANNRGFTNEQTTQLIGKAFEAYTSNEEIKKKSLN